MVTFGADVAQAATEVVAGGAATKKAAVEGVAVVGPVAVAVIAEGGADGDYKEHVYSERTNLGPCVWNQAKIALGVVAWLSKLPEDAHAQQHSAGYSCRFHQGDLPPLRSRLLLLRSLSRHKFATTSRACGVGNMDASHTLLD